MTDCVRPDAIVTRTFFCFQLQPFAPQYPSAPAITSQQPGPTLNASVPPSGYAVTAASTIYKSG
ncbi:hypothetical protein [Sphingosinithalassobacter portus]|uniref:hypothetical protein n=1 Tax=Stakelama portus TaxID=2676234 RepID=UPI0011AB5B91|nr:hypothetical protein [Sphingosinithalassobacter portus]